MDLEPHCNSDHYIRKLTTTCWRLTRLENETTSKISSMRIAQLFSDAAYNYTVLKQYSPHQWWE